MAFSVQHSQPRTPTAFSLHMHYKFHSLSLQGDISFAGARGLSHHWWQGHLASAGQLLWGEQPQNYAAQCFIKNTISIPAASLWLFPGGMRVSSQQTSNRTRRDGLKLCWGRFRVNICERDCPKPIVCGLWPLRAALVPAMVLLSSCSCPCAWLVEVLERVWPAKEPSAADCKRHKAAHSHPLTRCTPLGLGRVNSNVWRVFCGPWKGQFYGRALDRGSVLLAANIGQPITAQWGVLGHYSWRSLSHGPENIPVV